MLAHCLFSVLFPQICYADGLFEDGLFACWKRKEMHSGTKSNILWLKRYRSEDGIHFYRSVWKDWCL